MNYNTMNTIDTSVDNKKCYEKLHDICRNNKLLSISIILIVIFFITGITLVGIYPSHAFLILMITFGAIFAVKLVLFAVMLHRCIDIWINLPRV